MFARKTFWLALVLFTLIGLAAAQNTNSSPSPAAQPVATAQATVAPRKSVTFRELIDLAIRQERRMTELMRYSKPIVETYIQEQKHDSDLQTSPKADDYFLSRLDVSAGDQMDREFANPKKAKDKKSATAAQSFSAGGFALAAFPDLDHFDRQNYKFEFVRWEILGDVRCAVINVEPAEGSQNRRFLGRIWVEDQDFNIVRFTGEFAAKEFSKRSFHFDSWRWPTPRLVWMPAYIYTEESDPHDLTSHGLWFKAQTRIWGYDLRHAGDHREFAKPLADVVASADPKRHEASQDLSPEFTAGTKNQYTPEENFVERMQVAGLMAPDGPVDRILETVVNNLQVTNDLDIAGVRCRVLLTTPLESFVVGRTIVLSRGLLDVLPDEAALAAVLAHELAHIVLQHSLGAEFLQGMDRPFSDLETFAKLNVSFDAAREAAADKKGIELISKSPYNDKIGDMSLFLDALEARSPQLPNLLHGRFSNDFARSHLVGMPALAHSSQHLEATNVNQFAALPLGSRIKVDPWSNRIEMMKTQPTLLLSPSQKMPFEVSPFLPSLKRMEEEYPPTTPQSPH